MKEAIACPKCGSKESRFEKGAVIIDHSLLDELRWREKRCCYHCGARFTYTIIKGAVGCEAYLRTETNKEEQDGTGNKATQ